MFIALAHEVGRVRHPQWLTEFYTRWLGPEVQTLTILYTIFDRKGTLFVYLLLANGIPFTQ